MITYSITPKKAAEALLATTCHCGNQKKAGRSFCFVCFGLLPREVARPLRRKIGQGYERGLEEALAYLDKVHAGEGGSSRAANA